MADWIRFQFGAPQLSDIFWTGGNRREELQEAWAFLRRTQGEMDPLYVDVGGTQWENHRLYAELEAAPLPLPDGHQRPASDFGSPVEFALSYAFHAFAKGRLYALQDRGLASYHTHWFRAGALPRGGQEIVVADLLPPTWMFPWGALIVELRAAEGDPRIRDKEFFAEGLARLRTFTLENPVPVVTAFDRPGETVHDDLVDYARSGFAAANWVLKEDVAFNLRLEQTLLPFLREVREDSMELGPGAFSVVQEFSLPRERRQIGLEKEAERPIRLQRFPEGRRNAAVDIVIRRYIRELRDEQSRTEEEDES